jgi:hypothetical protein
MIGFASILRAYRVVSAMPAGFGYSVGENADLSCDENGAMWCRIATSGGSGAGDSGSALSRSQAFSSGAMIQQALVITEPQISIQQISAHSIPGTYLLAFESAVDVINGAVPIYSFACPTQQLISHPFGLRMIDNLRFAFSSTPGELTLGPYGWYQGVYTI